MLLHPPYSHPVHKMEPHHCHLLSPLANQLYIRFLSQHWRRWSGRRRRLYFPPLQLFRITVSHDITRKPFMEPFTYSAGVYPCDSLIRQYFGAQHLSTGTSILHSYARWPCVKQCSPSVRLFFCVFFFSRPCGFMSLSAALLHLCLRSSALSSPVCCSLAPRPPRSSAPSSPKLQDLRLYEPLCCSLAPLPPDVVFESVVPNS